MDPKEIIGKVQQREFAITREMVNEKERTLGLAFASETPYERYYGTEILGCKPDEVRMGRMVNGAPLLLNHDPEKQIGVVESASVDADGVCRSNVRFSKSALGEEIFQDVKDGIRKKVSVGYMVHAMILTKKEGNTEFYRATDWEPYENSIVSVAADDTVGIGRSKDLDSSTTPGASVGEQATISLKEQAMKDKDGKEIPEPTAEELERQRVDEIEEVGKRFAERIQGGQEKMQQLVKDAINLKRSAELFRGDIYMRVSDDKPLEVPLTQIGLTEKEIEKYSVLRVIQSQIKDSGIKAEFERECSDAIAKKLQSATGPRGILVPFEIQMRRYPTMQHRDQTVGSTTGGGNLVATNLLASSFIELLRHKTLAYQLGVRRLAGLVGNVAIPRQTSAGTFEWVSEGNAPTEGAIAVDQVTLTPRTGGGYTDYTRKLMLQSTPGIEGLVMDDLVNICRIGTDLAVFHGTGSGNQQPTGICGTSSIGSVSGAAFGWPEAVEFETDVATADADVATMAFVCAPSVRGLLKTREISSGFPKFVCEGNEINGYPVNITNQITAQYLLFGDFAQAMVGEWGGLDILVDPYTASNTGTVRVRAFITIDVGVRHPGAFSLATDVA